MERIIITICALALTTVICAQDAFPVIKGETPSGKNVSLPDDSKAGHTIIGLAYGRKAAEGLESWYEPAYMKFIAKHGLFASDYDVDLFFVPMFVGKDQRAYGHVLKKFAETAEPEIVDHIVFWKGEIEPYKVAFKGRIDDPDKPYFFIMDKKGTIVHGTSGAFTEEKLEVFEDILFNAE